MRITEITKNGGRETYSVLSDSGSTYQVRYMGSGDGDPEYIALWECTCPAGTLGKICKHVKAVIARKED